MIINFKHQMEQILTHHSSQIHSVCTTCLHVLQLYYTFMTNAFFLLLRLNKMPFLCLLRLQYTLEQKHTVFCSIRMVVFICMPMSRYGRKFVSPIAEEMCFDYLLYGLLIKKTHKLVLSSNCYISQFCITDIALWVRNTFSWRHWGQIHCGSES